jgi:hypothetical protein
MTNGLCLKAPKSKVSKKAITQAKTPSLHIVCVQLNAINQLQVDIQVDTQSTSQAMIQAISHVMCRHIKKAKVI